MAQSPRIPRPPRRHAPSRAGRVFGTLTLLLIAAVSITGGYLWNKYPALIGGLLHAKTPAEVFPNQQAINLMIIGRDNDYNDKDQVIKSRGRSDMLMVAHVDFAQKRISLLSIPRDTRVRIDGHGITKINAAHKDGGPPLSEQTVQENFGIASDKYVALDFQGFEQAIDLLGGVDLAVDKKMDYDDNWGHLHIHLKPGMQHLNGQQAMGFVRFRHSDSDLVRVQRQQALLAALKSKMRQPQTLAKLPALLDTINQHIDSDLTTEQKIVLARFAHDTPRDHIEMSTLPSREAGNDVITDWHKATPLLQSVFGVSPPETVAGTDAGLRRRHRRRHHAARVAFLP